MIRHATVFWVAVAGLFLTALTVVGSEVRTRDQQLAELHAAIAREQERIHVLRAERAYLASPEHIAERATNELGLAEFDADRIVAFADLPAYVPAPELEIDPNGPSELLLSATEGREDQPALISAAFLPPPRLESAGTMHQTAWVIREPDSRIE